MKVALAGVCVCVCEFGRIHTKEKVLMSKKKARPEVTNKLTNFREARSKKSGLLALIAILKFDINKALENRLRFLSDLDRDLDKNRHNYILIWKINVFIPNCAAFPVCLCLTSKL